MSLLRKLWQLANGDLLGRKEVRESVHPYFRQVVYFGRKEQDGYWEAELSSPTQREKFSVIIPAKKEECLDPYAALCKALTADMAELFALCKEAFEFEYAEWTKDPFPADPTNGFLLDGITLPDAADEKNAWSLCYFVPAAKHYFTAHFAEGAVFKVEVDG
ncbi:MAG: hypothetical protein ACKVK5_11415 [Pseudomonadales bacterium]|jgi:hypothetical protein